MKTPCSKDGNKLYCSRTKDSLVPTHRPLLGTECLGIRIFFRRTLAFTGCYPSRCTSSPLIVPARRRSLVEVVLAHQTMVSRRKGRKMASSRPRITERPVREKPARKRQIIRIRQELKTRRRILNSEFMQIISNHIRTFQW